jgi:DNA primase
VNLEKKVFHCFHPPCGAHGNVLDLWAAVRRLPLYEAARDLAATFQVPLVFLSGTGKRNT